MKILILNHDEIIETLSMKECIGIMRRALIDLADGKVYQPLRTIHRPSELAGMMGLMPSYIYGKQPAFGLKTICIFPENSIKGKDTHQGAVLLFDAETGELKAVFNASAITAIRTAAVSGVATEILARETAANLAIIGAGIQARSHLAAMNVVRSIKHCRIASRNPDNARRLADEMNDGRYAFSIEAVESNETALEDADIVVTATSAREPVIKREWVARGAHLNVVGSSTPNAREVDTATIKAASLFVDRRESTVNEAGDYLLALKEGAIDAGHIRAELGEILTGAKPGRTFAGEITLFKSLGLAVEDVAAAEYLYQKAAGSGVGQWVEF